VRGCDSVKTLSLRVFRWWALWVSDHTATCVMSGRILRTSDAASSWWLSLTAEKSRRTSSWCVVCRSLLRRHEFTIAYSEIGSLTCTWWTELSETFCLLFRLTVDRPIVYEWCGSECLTYTLNRWPHRNVTYIHCVPKTRQVWLAVTWSKLNVSSIILSPLERLWNLL